MLTETMVVGIDYGSKLAGTTVLAYGHKGEIFLERSAKGRDADRMILDFVGSHDLKMIGIDAPLSLPAVYLNRPGYEDYFYRKCDKELKAMSPMFLGGLTARAMRLKSTLDEMGIEVFEVYPVQTARSLGLNSFGYRSGKPDYKLILKALESKGVALAGEQFIHTDHDLDALLALYTATRILYGKAEFSGTPEEGVIHH